MTIKKYTSPITSAWSYFEYCPSPFTAGFCYKTITIIQNHMSKGPPFRPLPLPFHYLWLNIKKHLNIAMAALSMVMAPLCHNKFVYVMIICILNWYHEYYLSFYGMLVCRTLEILIWSDFSIRRCFLPREICVFQKWC